MCAWAYVTQKFAYCIAGTWHGTARPSSDLIYRLVRRHLSHSAETRAYSAALDRGIRGTGFLQLPSRTRGAVILFVNARSKKIGAH